MFAGRWRRFQVMMWLDGGLGLGLNLWLVSFIETRYGVLVLHLLCVIAARRRIVKEAGGSFICLSYFAKYVTEGIWLRIFLEDP